MLRHDESSRGLERLTKQPGNQGNHSPGRRKPARGPSRFGRQRLLPAAPHIAQALRSLPLALGTLSILYLLALAVAVSPALAQSSPIGQPSGHGHVQDKLIWDPGRLKPRDSRLKVRVGQPAPDFTLPSTSGREVGLSDFRGKKNVVLSFVPAAWSPVCSDQWPGYNLGREEIEKRDGMVLGISVDNVPTLHAWTESMGGCWFPVLSDFHPHGEVAARYGVLRSDGMTERAVFIIDKQGIIRYAEVADINKLPRLENVVRALDEINKQ